MIKKTIFYVSLAIALIGQTMASRLIEADSHFYTPMSTMVISGRDYLLTSNTHALIDMGSGLESYETLLFLKFDSATLPDEPVTRAWLRMASGAGGSMGDSTHPVRISVHPVDMDVMNILNGNITPRDYYVNNSHILDSVDSLMVFEDGVCYWDITEIVNAWIAFAATSGQDGYQNFGLAITGRDDAGADDTGDNEHIGFWSKEGVEGISQMPHAVMPVLILSEGESGFGDPWVPDWYDASAYTHQQWLFSAQNGRCEQPFLPDGYCINSFGEPNVVWQEDKSSVLNPFVTWHPSVDQVDPNGHPYWVDGVYGAPYRGWPYSQHTLTANVPTGSQSGMLQIFVQFDWYDGGEVTVNVQGAVDVTPESYLSYVLGQGENGYMWQRSTKVFELSSNSGEISVEWTLSGDEPYVDAVSVTTAVGVSIPAGLLRNPQDVNMDGYVNLIDFGTLSTQWQLSGVGLSELVDFAGQWLDISEYHFPVLVKD